MKIGIVVLCTNAYFPLGIRFAKRFMQFYRGTAEIVFYLFTDCDPKPYLPEGFKYEWKLLKNDNWVDGTNSKFTSILSLKDTDCTHLYYFDADTNVSKDFTEEWFIGDLVYDCFMGSGTTAKMAIQTGRNWIGSEISEEYCKIIEDRIKA